MSKPKPKKKISIKSIIFEEIENFFINEVLDNPTKTTYKKILKQYSPESDLKFDIYQFETKNKHIYNVEFYKDTFYFEDIELLDGTTLPDLKDDMVAYKIYIGFTPIETYKSNNINNDDKLGTLKDPYLQRTDRKEQYEVLGKIAYLVNEYIKNNPKYYVYVILKNTYKSNLNTYRYMFKKIFSNQFDEYESNDAFYYMLNN